MVEKPVSFRVVSPRIMITGIETMIRYILLRKRVFECGFLLWKHEQRSLKPAKTLPWGGTSQRCLRFGEVALLTVLITDKSLVSPPTHRVVPRCFTLDYDQGNWNYDPTIFFFWEKVFWNMDLYRGYTNGKHWKQRKRHLEVELASVVSKWVLSIVVKIYFLPFYIISPSFSKV